MFETHIFIDRLKPCLDISLLLEFPIEEYLLPSNLSPNSKRHEEDDGFRVL